MIMPEYGHQGFDREHPVDHIGRQLIGEQTNERNVELSTADLVCHARTAGVRDGDLHRGMSPVEPGQRVLDDRRGLARAALLCTVLLTRETRDRDA